MKFDGKEGIFIEGEVSPPLADVFVTITTESNEHQAGQVIDVKTHVNGKYRLQKLCNKPQLFSNEKHIVYCKREFPVKCSPKIFHRETVMLLSEFEVKSE